MSWCWRRAATLGVLTLAVAMQVGCAEERDPINRVQANALAKSFFVGSDLSGSNDDPEFWTQATLIAAPYGVAQGWLFPSSFSQKLARIKWQITEDLLLGRLTYELIEDADGRGAGGAKDNDGQIVVAYRITSHFDIRRAYNSSTGEEMNVIEENASDRPWYEREYFRVDWSENLQTESYDFDTLSYHGLDGVKYSSLAYYVNDPSDPEAPYFDSGAGYFDITNKAFATPQLIDLSSLGWGIQAFPACYLPDEFQGGTYPSANCNPSEITIRQSFRKVEDHDYEPVDWDGFRFQAFGAFYTDRLGFSRNYGMNDTKWHRFINRFQIWERAHYYADTAAMTGAVECNTPTSTPYGSDAKRDSEGDGTDDECWLVTVNLAVQNGLCAQPASQEDAVACYQGTNGIFGGSQCDTFNQKCTLPFRLRTPKTLAWFTTIPGNLEYFEGSEWATHEWDVALRYTIQSARYAECRATNGGDQAGCLQAWPAYFGQMDDHVDAKLLAAEVDDCRHGLSYPELGVVNSAEREAACVGLADAKWQERADAGWPLDPGIVALAKAPEMVVLCHSPVEAPDPAACAPADRRLPADVSAEMCAEAEENRDTALLPTCRAAVYARRGDLRYHNINLFYEPHTPSAWGIMTNATDPTTGEVISAGVSVWTHINELWTQGVMDRLRFIKGEIPAADVTEAQYIVDYEKAMQAASNGSISGHFTRDELRRRGAAFGGVSKEQLDELMQNRDPNVLGPANQLRKELQGVKATMDGSSVMAPIYEARRQHAVGTETEASLMTDEMQRITGVNGLGTSGPIMDYASPLRGMNPSLQRLSRQLRESALIKRGACMLEEAPAPVSIPALGDSLERKFAGACISSEDLESLCAQPADVAALAAKAGQDPNYAIQRACVEKQPLDGQCMTYGPFNAADSKGIQYARAERMRRYLAQRVHMSVIVHEMGHAVAARHNFVSSADSFSFRPQYWQLRTRNGAVTTRCGCTANEDDPTDRACENYVEDGSDCIGPRYFDPITQEEQDGLIWMWQQDSTMEYAGEYTQDLIGIGAWDYAGTAMWYGDITSVFADPLFNVSTDRGDSMLAKMDNFGGIVGLSPDWKGSPVHYTVQQNLLEMIKDCAPVDPNAFRPASWNDAKQGFWDPTLDGFIVKVDGQYTKCRQQKIDYVPWDQLRTPTSGELGNIYYRAGGSIDRFGRIRVPLGFATDSWADLGNASVYRHDNGADVYEIFEWLATQQEIHHIFDAYRRGRTSFSVRAAGNRNLERYNTKIRDGAKGLGLMANVYRDFGAAQGYVFENGYWALLSNWFFPDNILASGLVFDHFVRTFTRPEAGSHFLNADNGVVESEEDTYESPGATTPRVVIPTGATGKFGSVSPGGKLLESKLCEHCGEYDSSFTMNAGCYYDKVNAPYLMTESVDNFISDSREDFVDARYRAVSLADLFPEGYRRWIANQLTNDMFTKAPRLVADSSGNPLVDSDRNPQYPIGWVSYWPEAGAEVCWPANGTTICNAYGNHAENFDPYVPQHTVPIDPQVGWEVQKFLVNWTMLYLPENQKQKWINQLWIWELGQDSDPVGMSRIEFHDPNGKVFVAKTFGKECMFGTGTTRTDCESSGGKWVQKGISARVLEYANELLRDAYVVSDGPDNDNDLQPDWYLPVIGVNGVPEVQWSSDMQFIDADGYFADTIEGCGTDPDNDGIVDTYACPCSANYACIQLEKYVTVPFYIRQTMVDYGIVDPAQIGVWDF